MGIFYVWCATITRMTSTEAHGPDMADAELDVTNDAFDPRLDEELATVFDWLGNPPSFWFDETTKAILEQPDRQLSRGIKEMLASDGRASAVWMALSQPIRQAQAGFEKPEGDIGQTEFLEEAFFSPPEDGGMETRMTDVIGQMTWSFGVRRTFHEKVFTKRPDGKIVYKKLAWRPPESCEIWRDPDHGEILGFRQYQNYNWNNDPAVGFIDGYNTIRRPYAFIYTHGKFIDPVNGNSDLNVCLWAHRMKAKCVDLWQAFLDGQATPRTAVYGANDAERNARARAMARARSGGVVGFIRKGSEEKIFETIGSVAAQSSSAFQDMMRWLDGVQSESVMAGHLALTGGAAEGAGSLALSQDASSLYLAGRGSVAQEFEDAITTDLAAPLVRLNFGKVAKVPKFKFEPIDTTKLSHIFAMFNTLSVSGSLQVPKDFIYVLMELVGQYFDLPEDRVRTMIEDQKKEDEKLANTPPIVPGRPALTGIERTVDAAARVVKNGKPKVPSNKPTPAANPYAGRKADPKRNTA